jgi:hypothetical protein
MDIWGSQDEEDDWWGDSGLCGGIPSFSRESRVPADAAAASQRHKLMADKSRPVSSEHLVQETTLKPIAILYFLRSVLPGRRRSY